MCLMNTALVFAMLVCRAFSSARCMLIARKLNSRLRDPAARCDGCSIPGSTKVPTCTIRVLSLGSTLRRVLEPEDVVRRCAQVDAHNLPIRHHLQHGDAVNVRVGRSCTERADAQRKREQPHSRDAFELHVASIHDERSGMVEQAYFSKHRSASAGSRAHVDEQSAQPLARNRGGR